jgi:hypothetical protein
VKYIYFVIAALTWCLSWLLGGLLSATVGIYGGIKAIMLIRATSPCLVLPPIVIAFVATYMAHAWAKRRMFADEPIVDDNRHCCRRK